MNISDVKKTDGIANQLIIDPWCRSEDYLGDLDLLQESSSFDELQAYVEGIYQSTQIASSRLVTCR